MSTNLANRLLSLPPDPRSLRDRCENFPEKTKIIASVAPVPQIYKFPILVQPLPFCLGPAPSQLVGQASILSQGFCACYTGFQYDSPKKNAKLLFTTVFSDVVDGKSGNANTSRSNAVDQAQQNPEIPYESAEDERAGCGRRWGQGWEEVERMQAGTGGKRFGGAKIKDRVFARDACQSARHALDGHNEGQFTASCETWTVSSMDRACALELSGYRVIVTHEVRPVLIVIPFASLCLSPRPAFGLGLFLTSLMFEMCPGEAGAGLTSASDKGAP
ncbi:hypothetical protein BDK51DRAFT_44513 [Blyttiomyces helicus]|uniref:Uncharacterized protein n=1 Tax=Blyttiomyces helicus TaxID=388810 RepID=A0A4P9W8D7_9FUNG|nr:hypothetical protein BDK51DRAFT_44513 [Blyttiomyces helicus]|eukprot:RKO88791.1 hypothetical protein BDK51DRAFT_44513 [Blyttiomyces helicus]